MFYGTDYRPEDLDTWPVGDIAEAIAIARAVTRELNSGKDD